NPKYLESAEVKVFNFAYSGSPPSFFKKWYRCLFRRYYKKPKTVLYGVHWDMFTQEKKFEQDSEFFPAPVFFQLLLDPKTSFSPLLLARCAVFKYRFEIIGFWLGLQKESRSVGTEQSYKG